MYGLIGQIKSRLQQWRGRPVPRVLGDIHNSIHAMPLPLLASSKEPWKPNHFFCGLTPNQLELSCHASALIQNHCPHPPHVHEEEELLFLLGGEVEITLPSMADSSQQHKRLQPGQFVYYPAMFPHTIRAVSDEPANYLMFKWSSDRLDTSAGTYKGYEQYQITSPEQEHPHVKGYFSELLFQAPTAHLDRLHCHMTRLAPGSGYPAHADHHDIAIVFLSGECESLGQHVGPNSILFYAAGESHGIKNIGTTDACYLVFEFHSHKSKSLWSRLFSS